MGCTLVAGGCADAEPPCVSDEVGLSLEENTPFGQTLSQLIDVTSLDGQFPFEWYDKDGVLAFEGKGTSTVADFQLTLDASTAIFVDQRRNPDDTNDIGASCPDYIEVAGSLRLSTEDGWLDESALPVRLRYQSDTGDLDANPDVTLNARWGPLQESVEIGDLQGLLPSGLQQSTGRDYFDSLAIDDLASGVRLEVGTLTVLETSGGVAVGTGTLGCGSSPETTCQVPRSR